MGDGISDPVTFFVALALQLIPQAFAAVLPVLGLVRIAFRRRLPLFRRAGESYSELQLFGFIPLLLLLLPFLAHSYGVLLQIGSARRDTFTPLSMLLGLIVTYLFFPAPQVEQKETTFPAADPPSSEELSVQCLKCGRAAPAAKMDRHGADWLCRHCYLVERGIAKH